MPFPIKNFLNKDLRYSCRNLEKEFSESKIKYQTSFLYIVLLFGLLIGIVDLAINPNNISNMEGAQLGLRVALLVLPFICAIIAWKKPNLSEKQVIFLILFYFFGLMETSLANRIYWNNVMFFLAGMNIQFTLICSILAKISWKATCYLSILINIMNCSRYTDFTENYNMDYYPLIQFTQNTALISVSAYLIEKYNRESFYKFKSYEFYLSQYKDLIKNLFPSAVIITSGSKILFNNKETLKLFASKNADEAWEKLGKVMLEQSMLDVPKEKSNIISISEDVRENNMLFEKQNLTLLDVVISFGKSQRQVYEQNFYGEYEQVGCPISLDVKVMEIYWENTDSLLLIISENQIMQKMKLMREQSNYKNRLLATVSHDLRTPLSGIIGIINMTLEISLDPTIKKYLKIVHRSSRSLLFMINDILDYTGLSTGGITLNKERFSLWDCIVEVADLFKFHTKMKNINFEKRNLIGSNNHRAFIINDKGRVKQVIFNLLANAMKFTVLGYIRITLGEPTPLAYEISVEDSGIGIKKEIQHNIFKLFGRIQDPENEEVDYPGIGLGLPLSQSIVKILNNNKKGGVIKMESDYQKGSKFSFVIYHEGNTLYNEEILNEVDNSKKLYNSPTMEKFILILIVDQSRSNIELTVNTLKSFCDFIFDEAANGEEALRLIKIRSSSNLYYNLIIVDCDIDSFTGVQVMNSAKALILRQEIPFVPVVGISSNSSSEFHNRSLELGMADNISKPLSNEVMKAKLEKYLS